MSYPIFFNSNNLATIEGVDVYNYDANQLPVRDIKINKLARRDLSIITSSEYSEKRIPVFMDICGGSRAETEAVVDYVKALVQAQNGELVVPQGGGNVTYTATMAEFSTEWDGNKAYATVVFLASDPIGRADEETLFAVNGVTTSTWAQNVTVEGNATAYPTINLTLNSVTDGTAKWITIHNAKTNQGIRIERDWTAGEILRVDSDAMEVTVDGQVVDFTGLFPRFETGSQQVKIFDNFTARSWDAMGVYRPKRV